MRRKRLGFTAWQRKNGFSPLYDKALEINPNNTRAWHDKGRALENLGKDEEAISAYNKALEINPNDEYVWRDKIAVLNKLYKHKDVKKAGSQQPISENIVKPEKKTEDRLLMPPQPKQDKRINQSLKNLSEDNFSVASLRPRKKPAEQNRIEVGKLPPHDKKIQEGY